MFHMVSEPEKQYSCWAIAIYMKEYKLSYVPRAQNEIIARMMDAGKLFYTKLISKNWKDDWLYLKPDIYLKDKTNVNYQSSSDWMIKELFE